MLANRSYSRFNAILFLTLLALFAIPPLFIYEQKVPSELFAAVPMHRVFLMLFFSVFYEEAFYRVYLPTATANFLVYATAPKRQVAEIVAELGALFLFAFAHRYLGFGAVLYAAVAHCILRWIFRLLKKKSLAFALIFALHAANNLIVYFLSTPLLPKV